MRISDVYSAKGMKFKLNFHENSARFSSGALIRIEPTQMEKEFLVYQLAIGGLKSASTPVLCNTDIRTASYLAELFDNEKNGAFRCMFAVESTESTFIEIQAYTFRSVTEYKSPVYIQVPQAILDKIPVDVLAGQYIWGELGEPAIFCLNYKNSKKQNTNIRFVSRKRYLRALNTPRGIIIEGESFLKERYEVPVDVYIAPEIRFVPIDAAPSVNGSIAADLEKVSNPASYFSRWEAYNELSRKLLDMECDEFGEIQYTSCEPKLDLTGMTYQFEVTEVLDPSCEGKELGAEEYTVVNTDVRGGRVKTKQTPVGKIQKISEKKITTFLETADGTESVPKSGVLRLCTTGDRYILARRNAARDRMLKHQAPIKSIDALIEAGASEFELPSDWGKDEAVTSKLLRNYKKAESLNPKQREALSTAINTPDIAIIQGPPGTGKTTVIKAICERFREIYEAKEQQQKKLDPEHILRSPKILISSFQNEAVDNAISTPLPGDIPAYRKTAKRANNTTQQQYQRTLDTWYTDLCKSIRESITEKAAIDFVEQRKKLSDEFLSYKNSGESIEMAAVLIKHYLGYERVHYPQHLLEAAGAVIKAAKRDRDDINIPDPVVSRLNTQRLEREAFDDDGQTNAKRLASHLKIRDDLEIEEGTIEIIEAVCRDGFSDTEFERYAEAVLKLRKKYCAVGTVIDLEDRKTINACLLAMSECFSLQYTNTLNDMESKKSLILSEFMSQLEQEYESVVKKYSMTMAATCQTSLDLRDTSDKTFDLVVIDEAARANPLDLFIPMSMGRKIVLVGDHKQLPHMLEPDVLELIKNDPKFKDLPEIEKSLFERLFELFSKGNKPKAVLLTEQYRMHPDICKFVSDVFYDGQLKTAESITPEKCSSPKSINDGRALTFVNIPISRGAETTGTSKSRTAEVDAVCKDLKTILQTTDETARVGIITFYAAQVSRIKDKLGMLLNTEEWERVEVGTVDAFQGREFDYVMLSCVRSNSPRAAGELPRVGFLEKPNRLCVALSRAIRQLIVYGDAETLIQIPCFSKLYDICTTAGGGCYREY